jgi:RimJ/RimL family protein N-acetyltransferase
MSGAIETPRLTLRRLTPADAPFMLGLLNEPSFIRNIGDRNVRSEADAAEYIAKGPMASYERHGFGLLLVSLRAEPALPIGICGLLKRDALPHPDLGFAVRPPYWGVGYALEAAQAVQAYGRQQLALTTIAAIVDPENVPSLRLLGKLGFVRRGTVRLSADDIALELLEWTAA